MSEGLQLISAAIAAGSAATLLQLEPATLIGAEAQAYTYARQHLRTYQELPAANTIQEHTGVRLPVVTESLTYYLDRVYERFHYNQIRDQFAPMRDALAERNMDRVAESINGMSRVLRRRGSASQTGVMANADEAMQQVVDRLNGIRGTGGVSGILTDWPMFDTITGGYQNSDLITWVGRMGLGKTYILLRQVQKAWQAGEGVLFVTTEMSTEQTARRLSALELGLNPTLLKNGMISTYMMRRIQAFVRDMMHADRLKFLAVGMDSRVSAVDAACQEFGPSIVFVDGVYLMKPTDFRAGMNQREKVSGVFDEMKAMNLASDKPFVLSTQFSRQAGKGGNDGSLETIGYSDAIGTHSSVVVAIKDGPTENKRESRTLEFLKGREGEHGSVAINFKFAPLDMNEMTREERAEEGEVNDDSVSWMLNERRAA